MARKVAIVNEKGGVAKTTTATATAYLLAKRNYKTLLIDLDSQANSTSLNLLNDKNLCVSIATLLDNIINDEPLPDNFIYECRNGVHLIPANGKLSTTENNLYNANFREGKLAELVEHFDDKYDYIIIDCKGSPGVLMINALVCADEIIIPTQAQLWSVEGMNTLVRQINAVKKINSKLKIGGILFTIVKKNTKLSAHMTQQVKNIFGQEVRIFYSMIPDATCVGEACTHKKTICEYAPKSAAAKAYEEFVSEWLETQILSGGE